MPTSAASCATAPSIRSTSAASAASASGRPWSGVMVLVEPRLQDDLRGNAIALAPMRATSVSRRSERVARGLARVALVLEGDGKREAIGKLVREFAGADCHRMLGGVGVDR